MSQCPTSSNRQQWHIGLARACFLSISSPKGGSYCSCPLQPAVEGMQRGMHIGWGLLMGRC